MEEARSTAMPPIARITPEGIVVRGRDLTDVIGKLTFTEMMLLDLRGELPSPAEVRAVDAVMVTIMEHGVTPSSLTTRLVLDGAPESLQGAIAAGLLATGSRFLGVIEEAAETLDAIVAAAAGGDLAAAADSAAADCLAEGGHLPGFGHHIHRDGDPRVAVLRGIATEEKLPGTYFAALDALAAAAARRGRKVPINAAGAVAALLREVDLPAAGMRGFALVARCAGLFAHALDERRSPSVRGAWTALEREMAATEDREEAESR
ncbi:MAG TPA: citryl-CoA lyase [Solirubrobacterales bacterium]|jgi:citrate synthase|nr:citryl-CoA lyase [Solirubrobacterales bacterium]